MKLVGQGNFNFANISALYSGIWNYQQDLTSLYLSYHYCHMVELKKFVENEISKKYIYFGLNMFEIHV